MKENSIKHVSGKTLLATSIALAFSANAIAQEQQSTSDDKVEEVIVVGSQIRGAAINEALSVNVVDSETIDELGVESMDELMDMLPEAGQNFFNEAENISGGVNAVRGDIGAFNLRGIGTGNTLVLMNGRRMVNAAGYQTEEVGGGFIPVNTVNTQTIAPNSLSRVEVLRDGASAIYGADAVAGVINNVVDTDYEGLSLQVRHTDYESLPRDDQSLSLKWGTSFNDGASHIAVFARHYQRDRVSSKDDERWASSDFRWRINDPNNPWYDDIRFRNTSANSLYGQFDMSGSVSGQTDSRGEFEVFPFGDDRCQWAINDQVCGAVDGQGTERFDFNAYGRDLASELQRTNFMLAFTHEFANGSEAYTEVMGYQSSSNMIRHPSASFSTSKLEVGINNPYNPFVGQKSLLIDFYRYAERPRIVDNDGETFRLLQGFRGTAGNWDWDTAVTYSRATKEDITHNRVSNTLMQEALNDSTMDAYNPFSGGVDSNIERALIDVSRKNTTELSTFDLKFSNPEIYSLPAGPVGVLVGAEWRNESFVDDRDARLDGTIQFTDRDGDTYPLVSDVVNSSPTPDNQGSRSVGSLFTEFAIPVFEGFDVQLAARYERFSDVGDTVVGKAAFGYQPTDWLMVRGSWSEAFRAPNLVTVNEEIVARSGTATDYTCQYAQDYSTDPLAADLDCRNTIQRIAEGSSDLKPETSENTSFGIVLSPVEGLDLTLDFWEIDKTDTIGLLGTENMTLLDLVARLEAGTADCANTTFSPNIQRETATAEEEAIFNAAGICGAGQAGAVGDRYANLDRRITAGWDFGAYYSFETSIGEFDLRANISKLERFEQVPGGQAATLVEAQQSGLLPANYPVQGFADLIGQDGNQERRGLAQIRWRKDWLAASLTGNYIGSFYQSSLTIDDGSENGLRYTIPSMTTYDLTITAYFDFADMDNRVRFGIKNLIDERAPLADRYFGFFADAHRDYGRHIYLDYRISL